MLKLHHYTAKVKCLYGSNLPYLSLLVRPLLCTCKLESCHDLSCASKYHNVKNKKSLFKNIGIGSLLDLHPA